METTPLPNSRAHVKECSAKAYVVGLCRRFEKETKEDAQAIAWRFFVQYRSLMKREQVMEVVGQEFIKHWYGALSLAVVWIETRYRSDFRTKKKKKKKTPPEEASKIVSPNPNLVKLLALLEKLTPEQVFSANIVKLALLRENRRSRTAAVFYVKLDPAQEISEKQHWTLFSCGWGAIAKYLCFVDSRLFSRLPLEGFGEKVKTTEANGDVVERDKNKFVERFDKRSDNISYWVASNILGQESVIAMTKAAKFFVLVAYKCFQAGDYFAAYSILAGLKLFPVSRLTADYLKIDAKTEKVYKLITAQFRREGNWKTYRALLKKRQDEEAFCVPHLFLYKKDLVMSGTGNLDFDEEGKVNENKLEVSGAVLVAVRKLQICCEKKPITIEHCSKRIENRLLELRHVGTAQTRDEELHKLSLRVRPSKTVTPRDEEDTTGSSETLEAPEANNNNTPPVSYIDASSEDFKELLEY